MFHKGKPTLKISSTIWQPFFPRSQCVNPEARRNVPEPSLDRSDVESVWPVPDRFQPLQAVLGNIYANIYFTPTHHRHPISRSYGARHGAYAVRNWENIRRPITAPNNTCIYKICNPISINHTWLKAIMCSCFSSTEKSLTIRQHCRSNAVRYWTLFYQRNGGQHRTWTILYSHPPETPHILPPRASYGAHAVRNLQLLIHIFVIMLVTIICLRCFRSDYTECHSLVMSQLWQLLCCQIFHNILYSYTVVNTTEREPYLWRTFSAPSGTSLHSI